MNKTAKKVLLLVRDLIELALPILTFVCLFSVFVIQVFCRYVLRNPQPWASEATAICFLWTVLLGACYTQRKKSHVMFTLIYDLLPLKAKAFTAFLGNLIIAVAFGLCVVPTWKFVLFMAVQKTSILKIGMNFIYAPYMVFLILILAYTLIELYEDFMVFTGLDGGRFAKKLEDESKAEYQKAIDETKGEGDKAR